METWLAILESLKAVDGGLWFFLGMAFLWVGLKPTLEAFRGTLFIEKHRLQAELESLHRELKLIKNMLEESKIEAAEWRNRYFAIIEQQRESNERKRLQGIDR